MALAPNYESLDEAQRRLLNTVVLYDGEPVYVVNVRNIDANDRAQGAVNKDIVRVEFQRLPVKADTPVERKYISSRKFDFSPFKMGLLELDTGLHYLSRTTGRQQQQGLSDGNLSVTNIGESYWDKRIQNMVADKSLYNTIKGIYRSFNEVVEDRKDTGSAFSRSFSLLHDKDIGLSFFFHKNKRCGYIKDQRIILGPNFKYLSEELESCNAPIG
jgi:hypothetical protein